MKILFLLALMSCHEVMAHNPAAKPRQGGQERPQEIFGDIGDQIFELLFRRPMDIVIETPELRRSPKATYHRRKPEVVDTIVIHHTETPSHFTTEQINQMHLDRGSDADPWLMIGYHYTINSSYVEAPASGHDYPQLKVAQGRPFNIVGSHAGTDVYKPASQETRDLLMQEGAIQYGPHEGPLREAEDKVNSKGEVKANYNTVAFAIIGNYARRSRSNPHGYLATSPRYPTRQTIDAIAQLACKLQKEYPRITNIKWHSFYKPTSCPGLLACPNYPMDCRRQQKDSISSIKLEALRYGCIFN